MKPILYIIGGESTAVEIRETVEMCYSSRYSRVLNVIKDGNEKQNEDFISDSDFLERIKCDEKAEYIIGFTNIKLRNYYIELLKNKSTLTPAVIIHESAYISKSAQVGVGTYVAAHAVISSNAQIGNRCIINYQSMIGHDARIGNDCIINPGAKLSGHVRVGCNALIGANSMIFQGIEIGDNVMVDAMTYVRTNIASSHICSARLDAKMHTFRNMLR